MNNMSCPVIGHSATELAARTRAEFRFDAEEWIITHPPRYGKATLRRTLELARIGRMSADQQAEPCDMKGHFLDAVAASGGTIVPLGAAAAGGQLS